MEKLKNTRILGVIGIVGILIGLFTIYLKVEVYYISYDFVLIDYFEGKIIFLLTVANLLFLFKDYIKKYVPDVYNSSIGKWVDNVNNPKVLMVPTGIIAVLVIYIAN